MSSEFTDSYTTHSLWIDLGAAGGNNVQLNIMNRTEWTEAQITSLVDGLTAAVLANAPSGVLQSMTYTTNLVTDDSKNWDINSSTGAVTF